MREHIRFKFAKSDPEVISTETERMFILMSMYLHFYFGLDKKMTSDEASFKEQLSEPFKSCPSYRDVLLMKAFEEAHHLWNSREGQNFIKLHGFDAFMFRGFEECTFNNFG